MSLETALKQKIDSKEKWDALFSTYRYLFNLGDLRTTSYDGSIKQIDSSMWWAQRESLRLRYNVYETSEVLQKMNKFVQHFLHVSTEDRNMIAYTPDAQAGERDKQVRTTLGKYLTKFFPLFTDHFIRDTVAEHLSDLSTEIEFLEGSKAIVDGYLNGVHSCMAKEFNTYGHPAAVYGMPNIAMAVLRNSEGRINARAIVLKKEKVYIRHYGDTKLLKRLNKNGYKAGNWVGQELKHIRINHPDYDYAILMPYLDANGSSGSENYCNVAVIDNKLKVVDYATATRLQNLFGSGVVKSALTTVGFISITPITSDKLNAVDAITGEKFNILDCSNISVYVNKVKGVTCVDGYILEEMGFIRADDALTGNRYRCDSRSYFKAPRRGFYLDNEYNRKRCGFVPLDPTVYKDTRWAKDDEAVVVEGTSHYILLKDAITLVDVPEGGTDAMYDRGVVRYVHNTYDVAGYTKLHPNTVGAQVYCNPKVRVHKTPTGRKVAFGYSNIQRDYFGTVDFERNQKVVMCHEYITLPKSTPSARYLPGGDIWTEMLDKMVNYVLGSWGTNINRSLMVCVDKLFGSLYISYKGHSLWSYDAPWSSRAARMGDDFKEHEVIDKFIEVIRTTASSYSVTDARKAKRLLELYNIHLAEMHAEEAPHYLPYVEPVVQAAVEATPTEELATI